MSERNPQNLQIGDVVRLTGNHWPDDLRDTHRRITGIDGDWPFFMAGGQKWYVQPTYWTAAVVSRSARLDNDDALYNDDEDLFDELFTSGGEQPDLTPDMVNHPPHYKAANGLEVADFLDAFVGDDPERWNAGKYIMRAGKKDPDKFVQDLEKAIWYLERRIAQERARG